MPATWWVRIENEYADGHSSTRELYVPAPAGDDLEALEEWWEDVVFRETGDGHGGPACYTARILEFNRWHGVKREWIG